MARPKIFETTDASLAVCRCGEVILRGFSEGSLTLVDPWPADRLTEITALLRNRWTFTLINGRLHRRTGSTPNGHVLVEHLCGWVLTRAQPVTAQPPADDDDQPPF
jgi:hypothetical protein